MQDAASPKTELHPGPPCAPLRLTYLSARDPTALPGHGDVLSGRPHEARRGGRVIPDKLDAWTLEAIHEIAAAGVVENDRFDLKGDLQPAEHQRKVVAAFANSEGGFLVYGVTNDRRVEGVPNAELVRDFGSKLRDGLAPSVDFRFADRPHVLPSGLFVYVAHIPRSARRPHAVYVNNAWTFLKRTAAGNNDPMSYEEIRGAILDAGRRETDLAWLRSEVTRVRDLAERLNIAVHRGPLDLDLLVARLDVSQLKALLLPVFGTYWQQPQSRGQPARPHLALREDRRRPRPHGRVCDGATRSKLLGLPLRWPRVREGAGAEYGHQG
jgi:hypothetical protein